MLWDILLKGLQQKCHKILQVQSVGSASLKSKTLGRLGFKVTPLARVCCLLSGPQVSAAFSSTIYFVSLWDLGRCSLCSHLPFTGSWWESCSAILTESCFSATHGLLKWRTEAKGTVQELCLAELKSTPRVEDKRFPGTGSFPFCLRSPFSPFLFFFSSLNSCRGYFHSDFCWVFFFSLDRALAPSIAACSLLLGTMTSLLAEFPFGLYGIPPCPHHVQLLAV